MESLWFSWKEQRILLAICNAISVIWLGSLCRTCVGRRLRGPGVSLRLGSRTWEELSLIFTCEVSQCFSSPLSSPYLAFGCCSWSFFPAGKGWSRLVLQPLLTSVPPQPHRCLCPPTRPRENHSGSELTEPSVCFWAWSISCKGNSIRLVYLAC